MKAKLVSAIVLLAAAACSREERLQRDQGPVDLSRTGQPVKPTTTDTTSDSSRRPPGEPGASTTNSTGYATTGPIGPAPDLGAPKQKPKGKGAKQAPQISYTFGATAPGTGIALDCERLVPVNIRDQIRTGLTMTSPTLATNTNIDTHAQATTTCELKGAGLSKPVEIKADCTQQGKTGEIADARAKVPGVQTVQVGGGGTLEEQGDVSHLTAVDANSTCRIDVTAPKDVDTVAIGQAVLDQLPPG